MTNADLKQAICDLIDRLPGPPPVEPKPLDGKVGDIYEYGGVKWRLVNWAPAPHPSTFIGMSHLNRDMWNHVLENNSASTAVTPHNYHWHVEKVIEPAPIEPPPCPMCDNAMYLNESDDRWRCSTLLCEIHGPPNDRDGKKVRQLVRRVKLPTVTADDVFEYDGSPWETFQRFAGHIIAADEVNNGA